jgi:hypothetical protein
VASPSLGWLGGEVEEIEEGLAVLGVGGIELRLHDDGAQVQ